MTGKNSEKIFKTYNRAEDVVRCPHGRAPVRKMLDSYAKASVNLYGVISRKELVEIFNSQNSEKTTEDEIYILLLPLVLKDEWYCFYKEYVVHYFFIKKPEQVEFLLQHQSDKPRYIPEKDEFLEYMDEYYEDNDYWFNVRHYLANAFGYSRKFSEGYGQIREYITHGSGISELGPMMERHGFIFNGEEALREFFNLLMQAKNNTRIWENKGHSPNEIQEILREQNKNIIPFPQIQVKNVGRNDPCPCGSGKKYKKCCGLINDAGSAQLSPSECREFYETWYGLMGFVNEKKNIIRERIKAVYPNEISDVRVHKVREVLWEEPDLIDEYISVADLTREQKEILGLWRTRHRKVNMIVMEYLPEYAVVIATNEEGEDRLYGVKGISNSVANVLKQELPTQAETVLLPFKGKIIYDSFMNTMPVKLLEGAKKFMQELYDVAKKHGIITSLE
ncbi:MAG: SEC-C domain-containing protein [Clostridia bacterium]|nr:SEC-C domain-containing protein [Clostridia bacterium]